MVAAACSWHEHPLRAVEAIEGRPSRANGRRRTGAIDANFVAAARTLRTFDASHFESFAGPDLSIVAPSSVERSRGRP